MPTALVTDHGPTLVTALLEELRARRIVCPTLPAIERLGGSVRARAQRQFWRQLTDGLTQQQCLLRPRAAAFSDEALLSARIPISACRFHGLFDADEADAAPSGAPGARFTALDTVPGVGQRPATPTG